MSTSLPPELRDAIEEILHDATSRLLEVMARQQEQWLLALEQQLALADTTLRERRVILESLRQATAASLGADVQAPDSQASATAPWPPAAGASPRATRVRTADVVEDLRALLADEREGLRLGTLRERSGYGNMQLHRALVQLEEAGELTRKGAHRKTVYKPTRRLRRPRGRQGAPAPTARAEAAPSPSRAKRKGERQEEGAGADAGGASTRARKGGSSTRARKGGASTRARKGDSSTRTRKGGSSTRARKGGSSARARKGRAQKRPKSAQGSQRSRVTPRARTEEVKKAVLRVLRNRKKGLLMADLCALTGYTDKQLHRAIGALTEQGRIRKTGSSRSMRYALKRAR